VKVLGIMGSPRIGGNTDLLLDEALRGAVEAGAEVEKVVADRLKMVPCKEIYQCEKDGTCPFKDDMQPLYNSILAADVVIAASPMFFYTVSPQILTFISRCQALWARRYILKNLDIPKKKGAFIGVGATKGGKLFDGARLTMKYFFDAINADYTADVLVRGVDKKAEIKDRPEALREAYELGRDLVTGAIA
jgi:multimeric flavodoxin WrbA